MTARHESHQTGLFVAKGSDGRTYRVTEYTDVTVVRFLDGTTGRTPGLKSYRLDNGGAVNHHDDGSMTIVATGVTLTRE